MGAVGAPLLRPLGLSHSALTAFARRSPRRRGRLRVRAVALPRAHLPSIIIIL